MKQHALVIGSRGAIGSALVNVLSQNYQVHELHRGNCDFSEAALANAASGYVSNLGTSDPFSIIICTVGVLSTQHGRPEKRWSELTAEQLEEYFAINTIIPALVMKHFLPLLKKSAKACFACISAMVGSIQDNKLGGWYGYRASKAALNMIVKTASIELARTHKKAALIAIHPGTTKSELSEPFIGSREPSSVFTPLITAQRIVSVVESSSPEISGSLRHWDGSRLDW